MLMLIIADFNVMSPPAQSTQIGVLDVFPTTGIAA